MARVCVGLGALLGIAVPQWPYARACGAWLFLYMIAAGMVGAAGIWGARLSWDRRLGFTHIVALGAILWGFILISQEVLPRAGYAKAEATWSCAR